MAAAVAGLTKAVHVEVTGEPGIGKTWLLEEISALARPHGHLALSGCATKSTVDIKFGVFVDAIDNHVAGIGGESLPPDVRRTLAEIFPSFPRGAESFISNGQVSAGGPNHAVRLLLETIAATRPLVVTLDDLHLADVQTVDLIRHLLRSPPRAPVLLAVAYRPRQATARLRNALSNAAVPLRLHLQPMSMAQVRTFVGDSLSPAQCRALHRDSLGNPFYLEALLGRTRVDARIMAELDELSADARLAAAAGAVLGDDFSLQGLAVVAELDEVALYPTLDELVAIDLVRERPEPGRFTFRHPVVRQAIYRNSLPGWRLGARARAGLALAGGGKSVPESHASALPPLARLTRRERQVAELVSEGLTNRQIAASLFVTEKTVEMHLSNVFAKLDVRNRVGLARKLDGPRPV